MINFDVFLVEMSAMFDRFDRKPSKVLVDRYYEALSEQMNTEQFVAAAKAVFIEDDFFPSPKALMGKVKASGEDMGLLEWDKAIAALTRGDEDVSGYSPAAIQAFRSVGGLRLIGMADVERQLPFLKKEFLAAYKTYNSRPVQQLALESADRNGKGGLTRAFD